MLITHDMLESINQRALAALLANRLQREQSAREAGLPSPLLDRIEAPVSMVAKNAAAFIAECDAMGIQSQPDDSTKE